MSSNCPSFPPTYADGSPRMNNPTPVNVVVREFFQQHHTRVRDELAKMGLTEDQGIGTKCFSSAAVRMDRILEALHARGTALSLLTDQKAFDEALPGLIARNNWSLGEMAKAKVVARKFMDSMK